MSGAWAQAYAFGLVLWRASAALVVAPVLSARMVPGPVRLGLAIWGSVLAYLAAGAPVVGVPASFDGLAIAVGSEVMLGLASALGAKVVLDAAYAAGQTAAVSLGFGFGAFIDPSSGAESTAIGELLSTLALAAAVGLGLHREAFVWLTHSLQVTPPGESVQLQALLSGVVSQAIFAAGLMVRLSFPLVAAATVGHLVLGLIARTAPQLSLSTVGFSIAILAGGWALYLMAPSVAQVCAQASLTAWRAR